MRTDWVFETKAFFFRSSLSGSIGALDQYISPPGFTTETTKTVGIDTRTTNIYIGIDSSGLYPNQDLYYTPGIIYPNTKIVRINEGIEIVDTQSVFVGPNTTKIYGVNTSGLTTELRILPNANIIGFNAYISGISTDSIDIYPQSLNVTGLTTDIRFYQGNQEYNIDISARTLNSFVETVNLGFGTGTVVGIGSTFIFNADARFPSGGLKIAINDEVIPLAGIISTGYVVTGYDSYVGSATTTTKFTLRTEINPYRYVGAGVTFLTVSFSSLLAIGDYVRGEVFQNPTNITRIVGTTVYFDPPTKNTYALEAEVGFTRISPRVNPSATVISLNTVGIQSNDVIVGSLVPPETTVVGVGSTSIQISNPTTNTGITTSEFLFGAYTTSTNIITKNRIYLNKSGINTSLVGIATFSFGYTGSGTKVTTAEDYGDLIDVKFSSQEIIAIGASTIGLSTSSSGISTNQYLKPLTAIFDNELGTYVTEVNSNSIKINVGSSNTTTENILLQIGNLIRKENKRYLYNQYDSYSIDFLTEIPRGIIVDNQTAFPAYGNPPGSSNGDPSLRYKHSPFPFTSVSWDINKLPNARNYPYSINARPRAAERGRKSYIGPLYPRHIFGR